jgi:RNA polymerase sigma factor (sigma-70 family)
VVTSPAVDSDGALEFDALLARARTGDDAAWAELYDSVAPQLLGYVRSRGALDAEEVLGDVFLHVARGIGDFEGDGSGFRSWVFVIATSRLLDERRRVRRKPTDPLDSDTEERLGGPADVEAEVEQSAAATEVQALLAVLTPDQRTVIQLRIFGELTSQEISDTIGKPLGAVKALYRRGLGALRRELEPTVPEAVGASVLPFPSAAVSLQASAAVTEGS